MSTSTVIWGELLWDRFPEGDKLGGAPANVAWHLGLAGGWAQLVTRIGDDEAGRRALAQISEVCDTSLVQIDPERATGEVEVTLVSGEPRYRLVPGRAWERIACLPETREAIGEAGVLVYGTLAQRTAAGLAGWRDAIAAARDSCLKVCDVNLRKTEGGEIEEGDAVAEAIAAADVIKVNDKELARLAAWRAWRDPLEELRAGNKIVAVTRGAAGATIYGERGAVEVPAFPARPGGDNVGCGDAFVAILVHGMTQGWDLARCGRAASRWAAEVAGYRGATPAFGDDEIDALLEAV
jgi:fructokinase